MKILIINGSPKKEKSDTMHITRAFLSGMNEVSPQKVHTVNVIDRNIGFCRGCFTCKYNGGKCVMDDDIQPFAVIRLLSEYGQRFVEPVHQQAGFLHALHPAFDLLVAQRHLNIHILDQLVHAFKRPVKLGSNRLGETFQHPHQGAIVLEEHQRVVICAIFYMR